MVTFPSVQQECPDFIFDMSPSKNKSEVLMDSMIASLNEKMEKFELKIESINNYIRFLAHLKAFSLPIDVIKGAHRDLDEIEVIKSEIKDIFKDENIQEIIELSPYNVSYRIERLKFDFSKSLEYIENSCDQLYPIWKRNWTSAMIQGSKDIIG